MEIALRALSDRFWNKVEFIPFSDCWYWIAGCSSDGYGNYYHEKRRRGAHQVSYEAVHGKIEYTKKKQHLDHLCRNRTCVNPWHLELVTAQTNILRGVGITAKYAARTHCKYGHELSTAPGKQKRKCITCSRKSGRLSRERWRRRMGMPKRKFKVPRE